MTTARLLLTVFNGLVFLAALALWAFTVRDWWRVRRAHWGETRYTVEEIEETRFLAGQDLGIAAMLAGVTFWLLFLAANSYLSSGTVAVHRVNGRFVLSNGQAFSPTLVRTIIGYLGTNVFLVAMIAGKFYRRTQFWRRFRSDLP